MLLSKNTFSFLQDGTKEVFFDNSSKLINNSQFSLVKAGNSLTIEKSYNDEMQYRSILLFFSNESVFNFIRKFQLKPQDNASYASMYSFDYDLYIVDFIKSILNISKLSKSIQKNILDAKFDEIMLYLIEINGVDFLYSLINNSDNKHRKFIQTIEKNKLNKLIIKELSFLSNMSVSSFKRTFEKYFHSYLLNVLGVWECFFIKKQKNDHQIFIKKLGMKTYQTLLKRLK